MYDVWHETICIFNTGSALIWLWLWVDFVFYELYFLWFILYMVNYIPWHDSYDKIQLSFKSLVTESVSFHKFVLVVPLILNFVFHFMSYIFNGYVIFLHLWLYTNPVFILILLNYIFLKISLSLNPYSLGSTLGITRGMMLLLRNYWRRGRAHSLIGCSSLGFL